MDSPSATHRVLHLPQLEEVVGSDPADQREFMTLYVHTSRRVLVDIDGAIQTGDLEGVRRLAHKLRGSSATVGAEEAAELCRQLLAQAQSGVLTHAAGLRREIDRSVTRVAELAALP